MTIRGLLIAAAIAGAIAAQSVDATQSFPINVKTEGGSVFGVDDGNALAYKGIPYARSPVGNLRWRPPQPVQAWSGIRSASKLAPDCMQAPLGAAQSEAHALSEDCLYMNIWRPSTQRNKLPVLVWIHGGGFVNGGSSSLDSTGEGMAERGLVFVSFNYRLGHFGFFGFPALNAEYPEEAKGNYGLMDQIAALRWIRRNIGDFGGDPANVTVVGESAGGMSINYLMTLPSAAAPFDLGLFDRAIIQSGAGRKLPQERHLIKDHPGVPSASTLGLALAHRHGISGQDARSLAALRALSAEQIVGGLNMLTELRTDEFHFAGPIVDGKLIIETPEAAYTAGRQRRLPLIIGATNWDLGYNNAKTPEEAFTAFGPDAEVARRAYDPEGKGSMTMINAAIAGDRAMVEPARFIARAMSAAGVPAYEYRFSYVIESRRSPSTFGAQHATDVAFSFDRLGAVYGRAVVDADQHIADVMADYWANFARTGDPNRRDLPVWPVYRANEDRLLDFGADGTIAAKADPWSSRLDVAERASTGVSAAIKIDRGHSGMEKLPLSFEGELPCADCAAIRYHLDLLPNGLYFLRAEYVGTKRKDDEVGGWTISADGQRLVLGGGRNGPVGFSLEGDTALRWLKREGTSFVSGTEYVLKRSAVFQAVEPRVTLAGTYRYFADSGSFTPCGTQYRLPVAQENENAVLEGRYGRLVSGSHEEVLAEVEGRIVMRPKMEGEGQQLELVVERLIDLRRGVTCGALLGNVELEGTYWKLIALGENLLTFKGRQAEPHLILRREDRRVAGNAGCNRMMGQYTLDGSKLEFGRMATTMMACLAGMDFEQQFLSALKQVKSWRIAGRHLDFLDDAGVRIARFEAVELK